MKKTDLIHQIQAARDQLESILNGLSDEELIHSAGPDQWSIKDIVAHITFWQQSMVQNLKRLQNGEPAEFINGETDDVNEQVHSANILRPPELVMAEFNRSYKALLDVLQAFSEDDLNDADRFSFREGKPLHEYILGETAEHYQDHMSDLKAALERVKGMSR